MPFDLESCQKCSSLFPDGRGDVIKTALFCQTNSYDPEDIKCYYKTREGIFQMFESKNCQIVV